MTEESEHTLVFGLSADPVHQKHVHLVAASTRKLILRGFGIRRILLVPVYRRNPVGEKRQDFLQAGFHHRLAMCQMAAAEIDHGCADLDLIVEVSDVERKLAEDRDRPNYTVETLRHLRNGLPSRQMLIFLIGSDLVSGSVPEFSRWREPETIVELAKLAIYPRSGYKANREYLRELEVAGTSVIYLEGLPEDDMSSSGIRRQLAGGRDPLELSRENLLPKSVALYIKKHGLYRTFDDTATRRFGQNQEEYDDNL